MLNYRIQITKIKDDGQSQDWDLFDKLVLLYGLHWVLKSAKEVALAFAKTQ